MCWVSSKLVCKNSGDEKVPIYKVLGLTCGLLRAYFYSDFLYILNHIYESRINPEHHAPSMYLINEGLHCYSTACRFRYNYPGVLVTCIAETFSYPNDLYTTAVVTKGYIPPNTTYYINERGEIVTESLVLTEIIADDVLDI